MGLRVLWLRSASSSSQQLSERPPIYSLLLKLLICSCKLLFKNSRENLPERSIPYLFIERGSTPPRAAGGLGMMYFVLFGWFFVGLLLYLYSHKSLTIKNSILLDCASKPVEKKRRMAYNSEPLTKIQTKGFATPHALPVSMLTCFPYVERQGLEEKFSFLLFSFLPLETSKP